VPRLVPFHSVSDSTRFSDTPRMIFDKTGSLSAMTRHDYLPFGEEVYANTGLRTTTQGYTAAGYIAADKVRQKFTAQERDDETGLDFMHARYHSSAQGRFTSVDPISGHPVDPQSWNGYAYVGNNPLNATDPTGMSAMGTAHVGKGGEYIADFFTDEGVYGGEESWNKDYPLFGEDVTILVSWPPDTHDAIIANALPGLSGNLWELSL
jgi:RHS repeat-associated protein